MDPSNYKRRKSVGESALYEAAFLAAKSKLTRQDHVEKLSWDDVEMLTPIGYGGYSNVFRVARNGDEYALKCLNPGTMLKTKQFRTGAADLAMEGEILSRLCHENVIKLHGISRGGPLRAYVESDRGYFLVLDLLEDTLQDRLDKYRSQHKLDRGLRSLSSMLERVESVALGIAKGMEYLHKQGVALRDLKPDNVGFDANGTPKIFDLGFAREVHTINPKEVAGSLRYMAPEVAMGSGSQLASDVYSFGILLWELCTLEKPYKHINTREDFMEEVIHGGWRPSTSSIPSPALRRLIKECWSHNPSDRPTFVTIVKMLRVQLREMNGSKKSSSGNNKDALTEGFSMRRINTWTAKKLSNSSLGLLNAISWGNLSKKTADTDNTAESSQSSLSCCGESPSPSTPNKKNAPLDKLPKTTTATLKVKRKNVFMRPRFLSRSSGGRRRTTKIRKPKSLVAQ